MTMQLQAWKQCEPFNRDNGMPVGVIYFLGVVGTVLLCMALPRALEERSLFRFFAGAFLSFAGVLLPIGVFVLSIFLTPEWKKGCANGWIDCFMTGKLALLPLVMWGAAALFAIEVNRTKKPTQNWIVLGIFSGAVVATGCAAFGILFVSRQSGEFAPWLLVPLYTAVWFGARAVQLCDLARLKISHYVKASLASLPLWFGGLAWSWKMYQDLPVDPPTCFVVTAAMRGHRTIVGSLIPLHRNGHTRFANRQLIIFWRFEALWRAHAPASHRTFRRAYNRIGPAIARRANSPWAADALFIALKPAELLACLAVKYGSEIPAQFGAKQNE